MHLITPHVLVELREGGVEEVMVQVPDQNWLRFSPNPQIFVEHLL